MTIGNPTFCVGFYLTGVHFRGELRHVVHVGEQKIKCRPIEPREIAGAKLQDELYAIVCLEFQKSCSCSR